MILVSPCAKAMNNTITKITYLKRPQPTCVSLEQPSTQLVGDGFCSFLLKILPVTKERCTVFTVKGGKFFCTNFHKVCSCVTMEAMYALEYRPTSYGGGSQALTTASSFQLLVSSPTFGSGLGVKEAPHKNIRTKHLIEGSLATIRKPF